MKFTFPKIKNLASWEFEVTEVAPYCFEAKGYDQLPNARRLRLVLYGHDDEKLVAVAKTTAQLMAE